MPSDANYIAGRGVSRHAAGLGLVFLTFMMLCVLSACDLVPNDAEKLRIPTPLPLATLDPDYDPGLDNTPDPNVTVDPNAEPTLTRTPRPTRTSTRTVTPSPSPTPTLTETPTTREPTGTPTSTLTPFPTPTGF